MTEIDGLADECLQWGPPCDARDVYVLRDRSGGPATYRGQNPGGRHFCGFRVEGCLLEEVHGRKVCDFLLLEKQENGKALLIELKGSDLRQAVRQITQSKDRLRDSLGNRTVFARIVLSRVNQADLRDSITAKAIMRFKQSGGDLRYGSRTLTENL